MNVLERLACTGRAQLAGAVVSAIDSFYDDSAAARSSCSPLASWGTQLLKLAASVLVTAVLAVLVAAMVGGRFSSDTEVIEEKVETEASLLLEDKIVELEADRDVSVSPTNEVEQEDDIIYRDTENCIKVETSDKHESELLVDVNFKSTLQDDDLNASISREAEDISQMESIKHDNVMGSSEDGAEDNSCQSLEDSTISDTQNTETILPESSDSQLNK